MTFLNVSTPDSREKLDVGKRQKAIGINRSTHLIRLVMFLHVTGVRHQGKYRLEIAFNDGAIKEVDLAQELTGEIFEPLRDVVLFQQVFVNKETNTIEWPNGADFAPEFLYEVSTEVTGRRSEPVGRVSEA
jgi:Protein of unknown function (DUF2442)